MSIKHELLVMVTDAENKSSFNYVQNMGTELKLKTFKSCLMFMGPCIIFIVE